MGVNLYFDVHVPYAITFGLRLRGVDVLTSQEDGTRELDDDLLLDRATELGRVLFSQDKDLLREAQKRQQTGVRFGGVIYAPQLGIAIGHCIDDLELIAQCTNPDEWLNRVDYLPLK
ncbi:MAG: DUF5615 family PIN-like protein [Acidobacteria bacterium]|nr:DUF5615 family PIN-like protein [Acidobacteriota bacterium]